MLAYCSFVYKDGRIRERIVENVCPMIDVPERDDASEAWIMRVFKRVELHAAGATARVEYHEQ